jgi:hypothetical protein
MASTLPAAIRAEPLPSTPFSSTLKEIRRWLDSENIQPTDFKTIVSRAGVGFEISFRSEVEAQRFQRRFRSLVAA